MEHRLTHVPSITTTSTAAPRPAGETTANGKVVCPACGKEVFVDRMESNAAETIRRLAMDELLKQQIYDERICMRCGRTSREHDDNDALACGMFLETPDSTGGSR